MRAQCKDSPKGAKISHSKVVEHKTVTGNGKNWGCKKCQTHTPSPPCISYAVVQGTAGVGTILIWDFCIAYTRGGGGYDTNSNDSGGSQRRDEDDSEVVRVNDKRPQLL